MPCKTGIWEDPVVLRTGLFGTRGLRCQLSSPICTTNNEYCKGKEQVCTTDAILCRCGRNCAHPRKGWAFVIKKTKTINFSLEILHESPTLTSPHSPSGVRFLCVLGAGLLWWVDQLFGKALEASSSTCKLTFPVIRVRTQGGRRRC